MPRSASSTPYPGLSTFRSWWRSSDAVLAALLFVTDALLLGQGLLAALLFIKVFGGLVPKALLLKKVQRDGRPTVRRALLFGLTAVAIMMTVNFNNHLARQRAIRLIAAIELFHATHGRFPLALEALVPRYLGAVPRAKLTLAFSDFQYQTRERGAMLAYIEVPPFGVSCYDFGERRWHEATARAHHLSRCGHPLAVAQQESGR